MPFPYNNRLKGNKGYRKCSHPRCVAGPVLPWNPTGKWIKCYQQPCPINPDCCTLIQWTSCHYLWLCNGPQSQLKAVQYLGDCLEVEFYDRKTFFRYWGRLNKCLDKLEIKHWEVAKAWEYKLFLLRCWFDLLIHQICLKWNGPFIEKNIKSHMDELEPWWRWLLNVVYLKPNSKNELNELWWARF